MPSSNEILRQATKLVSRYRQPTRYYSEQCSQEIDLNDVSFPPDFFVALHTGDVEKLTELVDSANKEAQRLIEYIEHQQSSFFVTHIYRSENWSLAHKLLRDFVIKELNEYRDIAKQHTIRIKEYSQAPKPKYYEHISSKPGNYHDDIQRAIDALRRILNISQEVKKSDDINYLLLQLLYASCYMIKKFHRVELHISEWNSFKKSMESWYVELTDTSIPQSTMTKTQDGGTIITDYLPHYWSDMDKLEKLIDASVHDTEVLPRVVNEFPNVLSLGTESKLRECLEWLNKCARDNLMPKVIFTFHGDE